jgi:hypothetical protein
VELERAGGEARLKMVHCISVYYSVYLLY